MCYLIILLKICKLCERSAKTQVYRSEPIIFIGIEKKSFHLIECIQAKLNGIYEKKTFADVNIHCKTRGF